MSDTKLRRGYHVPLLKTLTATLDQVDTSTCQFYLGPNVRWGIRSFEASDIRSAKKLCRDNDRSFLIHSSLLSNLANSKEDVRDKTKLHIQDELNTVKGLPCGVVLHIGKHLGTSVETGIAKITAGLNDLKIPVSESRLGATLLLENGAGQGTEIGTDWRQIRKILEGVDSVSSRIGVCIDTCHAFAAKMSSFETPEHVVKLFDAAERVGLRKISAFHLNDSKKDYGSRVDRHAPLGHGVLWRGRTKALQQLLSRSKEHEIDLVCETSDAYHDMKVLRRFEKRLS